MNFFRHHLEHMADELSDLIIRCASHNQPEQKGRAKPGFFARRDRRLTPYEKRCRAALSKVWDKERRILISNLAKLGKAPCASRTKWNISLVDLILYPLGPFKKELAEGVRAVLEAEMLAEGQDALESISVSASFDVDNPRVTAWLDRYTVKLSDTLEQVNEADIRRVLAEGIGAGEGIPDLSRRINELFETYDRARAESIARTETIRASNEAALEAYRESGVVKLKTWLPSPDSCELCIELGMKDPIPLEEPFFEDDYGDGQAPPRHVRCTCAAAALIED